jgi:AcrR family transcriptional regulator
LQHGAEVSPETVYAIFKNKRAVLQAVVEAAVTGTTEGGELLREELFARMAAEPDPRRRFALSDFYRALTVDRRWSHQRAFDALNDTFARMLFDD